jgi:DNA mismatch repair protein MSH5
MTFHPFKIQKARDWDTRRAVSQLCHCLDVRQLAKGPHSRNRENAMYLKNERLATSSEAVSSLFFMDDKGSRQGRDEGLDPRRNYDRLSCVIDFMSESLLVKALGALLVHLQCTTFQLEIGGRVTVQTLERFDLGSFVHLDSNALTSLQIFHEEKHPNVISGRGKAKEGFSLFALLDQTHSLPGRKCLKEWMLRPLRSVRGIRERQNMVELLLHPEAMEVVTNAGMLLGKVGDVQRILTRMRRAGSTVNDWLTLANTAEHVLLLQSCLAVLVHLTARLSSASDKGPTTAGEEEHRTNEGPYSSAMAMLQGFLDRISRQAVGRVSEALTKVLDLEVTRESKTVAVRMGCDEELDRLRGDYDGLEEFLSEEARGVLAEQSSQLLSKISVQFLPQVD